MQLSFSEHEAGTLTTSINDMRIDIEKGLFAGHTYTDGILTHLGKSFTIPTFTTQSDPLVTKPTTNGGETTFTIPQAIYSGELSFSFKGDNILTKLTDLSLEGIVLDFPNITLSIQEDQVQNAYLLEFDFDYTGETSPQVNTVTILLGGVEQLAISFEYTPEEV